jgi:hypothetical protein
VVAVVAEDDEDGEVGEDDEDHAEVGEARSAAPVREAGRMAGKGMLGSSATGPRLLRRS